MIAAEHLPNNTPDMITLGDFDRAYTTFRNPTNDEQALLVGLTPTLLGGRVPNIATGWNRNEVGVWGGKQLFPDELSSVLLTTFVELRQVGTANLSEN